MFAEEQFAAITAGIPQPVLACDAEGLICHANAAASRLSGRAIGELIGTPVQSLLLDCPVGADNAPAFDTSLLTADGTTRRVRVTLTPAGTQTEGRGFVLVLADLSAADELLEDSGCPFLRLNDRAEVLFATQSALELLGCPTRPDADLGSADALTGQSGGTWSAHLASVAAAPPRPHCLETRHSDHDGRERWLRWITRPTEQPGIFISLAAEATEARQARSALREDGERYRLVLAQSPLGIVVYDTDLLLTDCNERFAGLLQSKREDLLGLDLRRLHDGSLLPCLREPLAGNEGRYEGRYDAGGDKPQPYLVLRTAPLLDPQNRVVGAVGITEDISRRKAAEEVARRREQEMLTLLETLPAFAFFKDRQGVYVAANRHFCRAVGRTLEEVIGSTDADLFPASLADKYRVDDATVIAKGQPLACEEQIPSGETTVFVATRKVPLFDAGGRVSGLIGLAFDITDHKRAEDGQRLAAVGQLAAGVAHEFNNLLAAMSMHAELATARAERAAYEELAEVVTRFSRRGAEISRNLMAFAHPGEPKRQAVRLEDRIEAALALAAREIEAGGITVDRDYLSRGALVAGDPARLQQVFLNLFINACQAMPGGGVLQIRTRLLDLPDGPKRVLTSVIDTGSGIRPEHRARIFEPFFTTKGRLGDSDTPGTGLGLSVAHGIVKAHGGLIRAVGEAGRGARFDVELPLLEEPAPRAASPAPVRESAAADTPLRVLVTDDEWELLAVMGQVLADQGCHVACACGTREAAAALESSTFDLVIADWLMPGGGGQAVAAHAAALPAPPRVVIMTGRLDAGAIEAVPEFAGLQCLQKPFTIDELTRLVQQVHAEVLSQ